MAWKNLTQTSLADAFIHQHEALTELDELNQLIDWKSIELQMITINNNPMGERAWPPLMMFKVLLLQSFYNLSDPACEKQLARDLLFRRFVNLSLTDPVPDHSTIWRFRNTINKSGLLQKLLDNINHQLNSKGVIIKNGQASIIDATVIQAKNNRPNKNAKGENTQDKEASYNVKTASDGKKKVTYGFKAHINVDEDGFILAQTLTTGSLHDSNVFEQLLTGHEEAVYADSAYKSQKHDALLQDKDIQNNILGRAYKNKPLTEQQKLHNKFASQVRYVVERTIGVAKKYYGLAQARYMGIERNQARLTIICIAHNLKRAVNIQRSCA
ncbi:MAG: IS5 family transposase [Gammaproteobacteria bacterium]|nr:IS5 family transposase [Gammaproteobacteria bacterium]MBD3777231.1 IS5 family transposase [Thiotrichales bacterium]